MSLDAWITLVVVLVTVAMLVRDLVHPVAAVLGAVVVLLVLGVVDAEAAFAGFSNPAPITVAALYVLARSVEATGALEPVMSRVMGSPEPERLRKSPLLPRLQLLRVTGPAALSSAFLNNTPIVAMVAPQIVDWSSQRGLGASRLLMPLSFAAILGGLCTAIGTSTNLVVSGLMEQAGQEPLGMFEIGWVGLPLAVAGLGLMALLTQRVLPERQPAFADLDDGVRHFSVAMEVIPGGPVDGRTVAEAGLRDLQGVYLVQVERGQRLVAPVSPDEVLQGTDVLTFVGKVDLVVDLQRKRGLASTENQHLGELAKPDRHTFFEAVVGVESPLAGRTLKDVGFRGRYQAAVVAIHRAGERVDAKLGEVPLRPGDTLLVLADPGFRERWGESADFLLVARRGGSAPTLTRKAPLVGAIILGLVLVAGTGLMPILHAALVAGGLLVLTGVLTAREARDAVDLNVVVLIAAAFGLGAGMSESGLADALSGLLVRGFSGLGDWGVLLAILLATMVLTEIVTNNAAAVLMFPLAMASAAGIGADPRPFALAVAVGASAAFLTPIGYQTNTMVYGLGGYRFTDYARLGAPLSLAVIIVAMLVIPWAWPLRG